MISFNQIKYISWHRGMKEMDLILGHFFDAMYLMLTQEERERYIQLLQEDDYLLYHWIIDQSSNVQPLYEIIINKIRTFHGIGISL